MNHNFTTTITGTFSYDYGSDACYMWNGGYGFISDTISGAWSPIQASLGAGCVDGGSFGPWLYQGGFNRAGNDIPFELQMLDVQWRGEAPYPFHVAISESVLTGCFADIGCGSGNTIFDTHFSFHSWEPSETVIWGQSVYHLLPDSQIAKTGSFSSTGSYTASVFAMATTTSTLYVSAGGAAAAMTITPLPGYSWFSTTVSVASNNPQVVLAAGSDGEMISVDQVCFSEWLQACGVAKDYHFLSPTSWTKSGNATWASHGWTIGYGDSIQQPASWSSGTYSVTVRAKGKTSAESEIRVAAVFGSADQYITIPASSTEFAMYTTTLSILWGGAYQLKVDGFGSNVVIDSICVTKGYEPSQCPCGLTITESAQSLIQNGGFEEGFPLPYTTCTIADPIECSIKDFRWVPYQWHPRIGFEVDPVMGVKRAGYGSGYSLGLLPPSNSFGIAQDLHDSVSTFNLLMRVKPCWSNAKLHIGTSTGDIAAIQSLTNGVWSEISVFYDMPSSEHWPITMQAVCDGVFCVERASECRGDPPTDIVRIDDVCVIPMDRPIMCNQEPPPVMSCVNSNSHFADGPDGPSMPASGSNYAGGEYGWTWANARVGNPLGSYPHSARLYPTNAYIRQWLPVSQGIADRDRALVVGQTYHVTGDVQRIVQSGESDDHTLQIRLGYALIKAVDLSAGQTSISYDELVTITSEMVVNGGIEFSLQNGGNASALLNYACIIPTITATVPYSSCLGSWTTSGGDPIPGTLEALDYAKNSLRYLEAGPYKLSVAGSGGPDTLGVSYLKAGNYGVLAAIEVGEGEFDQSTTFVVPFGGLSDGELILGSSNGIEITNICLQALFSPAPPGGGVPIIPPIPKCGNVNSTVPSPYTEGLFTFYKLEPYIATTGELSGTLYNSVNWGRYMAMESYNYSIYPLVCTTISIANWNVDAYNALMKTLDKFYTTIMDQLDEIEDLLEEILEQLKSNRDWISTLIVFLIGLATAILATFSSIIGLLLAMLALAAALIAELLSFIGQGPASLPISCADDAQWMCYGMSIISTLDANFGSWLMVIVGLVLSILSYHLSNYMLGRIRDILQGQGPRNNDD